MTPAGFPHSDIPGSKPACGSPRLIAAYHVLHRLLVPRHPPCALSSLTGLSKVLSLYVYPASRIRLSKSVRVANVIHIRSLTAGRIGERESYQGGPRWGLRSLVSGGDSGARTRSLRLAKPALSQLSYIPPRGDELRTPTTRSVGGPGWTRTTHLTLIRRAL